MSIVEQYLLQLNTEKRQWRRAVVILSALSLIVALVTGWNLRLTGITIANSASCGYEEHLHAEECIQGGVVICEKTAHQHSIGCYPNPKKDTETLTDWNKMFEGYPYTGVLREDLVGIAKTQVGYTESKLNFEVNGNGERKGYTRYGAWYGAPYNDWSAMFISFCLNYAGADASQFPLSSGAASMAGLWQAQGKYIPADKYIPRCGDIVFFNNNTAGIVSDVFNASFCVIRGDMQNEVRSDVIFFGDASVTGWGITEEESDILQNSPAPEEAKENSADISNGPTVQLSEGNTKVFMPQPRGYSFRSPRAVIDLHQYLQANGGGYFFTLLDVDNMELPKDDQGNFIAQANTRYNLTVSFSSPKGFLPGTYQYQIPNGLMVDGGSGEFVLSDQTNVGSWIVTDTGLITLMFNENMNSLSEITISATLGIHFPEQSEPIDFDGFITVKVEPPAVQKYPTLLSKWGSPDEDAGKLKWFVRFVGQADSQIPGSILTDQVTLPDWGKPHSYTESDIAAGIVFSVTSADGGWHTWTVTTDDPHLIWNESGWSYKVPKTVTCIYCGELELGNNGWDYMASYTSTPTPLYTPETVSYENKVTIDGQTIFGWNQFTHGQINARVEKNGYFVSDASGGGFLWEFQVDIPGRVEGERAEYAWFIMDEMKLMDKTDTALDRVYNDVNLATVVATYNGNVIQIPRIQDATDQDMFAWDNAWTSEGIASTRTINLLCRCQCTPETCHWGGCEDYWFVRDDGTSATNGFCQCWTETQNMTFTFVYKTTDLSIIRQYGSLGYQLNNLVQLFYMTDGQNSIRVQYDDASITIPNLFEKQLTQDFNGYTAHYMITVNESKASLTNGTPLTIHDTMTDTLAYISGSLVITAENANGEISTLQQGVDFTVTYDGSSGQTDSAGKAVHTLKVVILNPQPVMYILDYDTTLIMPDQVTGGVKYSNSASIELWGQNVSVPSVEKVYADINIAAKDYKLEMLKTCAQTGKPLEGATFGLYNVNGGLIISKDTNASGMIEFKTDVAQGIVLQEHVLYYLQEIKPPPTYLLDDTRYMLCFCSNENAICTECDQILNGTSGIRIRQDETALIEIVNYFVHVELPGTGGTGTRIYMLCGLALMTAPFIYAFKRKRKYERRSSG